MGFGDRFVGNKLGSVSIKVQCTGCQRITVVRLPPGKSFEKWNEKATCSVCNGSKCWKKFES